MTTAEYWTSDRVLVRWMCTQWCNFSCWYCRQDHSRKQLYKGGTGHWVDAAPVSAWADAFDAAFSQMKLSLILTGGEPTLDVKSYTRLMQHLDAAPYVEQIRVDTNGSAPVHQFPKVRYMVTYHPTQMSFEDTLAAARRLDAVMVNYVANPGELDRLDEVVLQFAPIPVNVLPAFGDASLFTPEELVILQQHIHPLDWPRRIGEPTKGLPCDFPGVAYEMEPDGRLKVGCTPSKAGNLLRGILPIREASPCPDRDCYCTDKYSFLYDVEFPIDTVVRRIRERTGSA